MKTGDRDLGMDRPITRRDFLHGLGALTAGFIVSLFLLPCTSGPYVVVLGLLAEKVELAKTFSLLVLYNLIFVAPMIAISKGTHKKIKSPSSSDDVSGVKFLLGAGF